MVLVKTIHRVRASVGHYLNYCPDGEGCRPDEVAAGDRTNSPVRKGWVKHAPPKMEGCKSDFFSTTAVYERNRDLQPSKLLLLPYPGLTAWAIGSPSFVGLIGLAALTMRTRELFLCKHQWIHSIKSVYRTAIISSVDALPPPSQTPATHRHKSPAT